MRLTVFRTKMCGGGHTYRVYVPRETVRHAAKVNYEVVSDGRRYLLLADATLPASHFTRERGPERLDAYLDHEQRCRPLATAAIHKAFPETTGLAADGSMSAWLDGFTGDHAVKDVDVEWADCGGEATRGSVVAPGSKGVWLDNYGQHWALVNGRMVPVRDTGMGYRHE